MFTHIERHRSRSTILSLEALETRECPAGYTIVDLLPAPGGLRQCETYHVNNQEVAVGRTLLPSGYGQATVWPAGTGSTRAGAFLPMFPGQNYSEALDVNDAGLIIGSTGVVSNYSQAVVWVGSGNSYSVRDLGSLSGSFTTDYAHAISEPDANGVMWIAGASTYPEGDHFVSHATVWRVNAAGSTLSTIDLEPNAYPITGASDVRVIGSYVYVTGEYYSAVDQSEACYWKLDLAGNVISRTGLGTLGGAGSNAYSINQYLSVAGSSQLVNNGISYAFLYQNGSMTNLGSLGDKGSWASAVNDSHSVVGSYYTKSKPYYPDRSDAFIWSNNTMLDLRNQLSSRDRSNWARLFFGSDINNDGDIVGNGSVKVSKNTYENHGFLIKPMALEASATGPNIAVNSLTIDMVQPLLSEAIRRWTLSGAATATLSNLNLRIVDLPGTTLGYASGNTITLDSNAAGWGWFVDKTPKRDSEFHLRGNQGEQGRMDLLTVLMHETGHLLGRGHSDHGLMAETLAAGTRSVGTHVADAAIIAGLQQKTPYRHMLNR